MMGNAPTARRIVTSDISHAMALASRYGRQNAAVMAGVALSDIPPVTVRRNEYAPRAPQPKAEQPETAPETPVVVPIQTPHDKIMRFIREIAERRGVTLVEIMGSGRTQPVVWARWEAMAMAQERFGLSLLQIGRLFRKDHTSVLHGLRRWRSEVRETAAVVEPIDVWADLKEHLFLCDLGAKGSDEGAIAWRNAAASIRALAKQAGVTL